EGVGWSGERRVRKFSCISLELARMPGRSRVTSAARGRYPRSIAEIKAVPRTKPLQLHQPGHRHQANLRPSAITRCEGLRRFPKEQQISFARRSGQESRLRTSPALFEYPDLW